ncbi:hypothetical protein ABZT23_32065 [Streptomyces sp. NPDC005386]|uniref:hypothetical protein n=1 Tax=Streptomyces sp. NPDC005386 TaxID=3154562 RepID=UPI0033A07EC6
MAPLSPAPGRSGSARPTPPADTVTWPHVAKILGILLFMGWMLTHGYTWYLTLAITSGAVTIATGLPRIPVLLTRIVQTLGTDQQ